MYTDYKRLVLQPHKDKSLLRKHPWLFSGAIKSMDNGIEEGDLVEIYSCDNQYLATGYYQKETIAVKILTFDRQPIDKDFINRRILSAVNYRKALNFFANKDSNIFRLVNAEGDFLPGLIVDYYDGNIVLQFHSLGMYRLKNWIVEALLQNVPEVKTIFSKSSSTLPKNSPISLHDEFLYSSKEEEFFLSKENGCKFLIDYKYGQKTGFFIDQRSNRELLSTLSKDKNVLNCFAYTGGFSIAALKGGAKSVESLDISKRALDICNQNVKMNGFEDNHISKQVDVVDYLNDIHKNKYDIIILDPPAFAKHHKDVSRALKGYRSINQKAMQKIAPNGLLFTFSCSQAVNREDFLTMLFSCAAISNRKIRIVRRLPHNFDHPQSIFHPEGEYLKGFLLYIE